MESSAHLGAAGEEEEEEERRTGSRLKLKSKQAKFVSREMTCPSLCSVRQHAQSHSYSNSELQFSWQASHGVQSRAFQGWATAQESFSAAYRAHRDSVPGQPECR